MYVPSIHYDFDRGGPASLKLCFILDVIPVLVVLYVVTKAGKRHVCAIGGRQP